MGKRLSWDEYFTQFAEVTKKRATCDRLLVGSVIVKGNNILSTGYNGSPKGEEHCIDVGCQMKKGSCIRTIHAEMNAIMNSLQNGVDLEGSTLYVTHYPCYICAKHIVQVGIIRVVYIEDYRNGEETEELFKKQGVELYKIKRGLSK